jgi:glycosyltransferase involved in cell wall biosynthesis
MAESEPPPVVLHVLPYDLARGAQRYARTLVDALADDGASHLILTLFRAEPAGLRPDIRLDVPRGLMRRMGIDPRVLTRLRRQVGQISPDVVVAHGGEPAKYCAIALPRSIPLVYLKIGTGHKTLQRTANRSLHGFYTRRADVVAAVSNDVADEAHLVYGVPRERLVVIPNARDPRAFAERARERTGPPRIIYVGHLDAGKRPDWFVDIVAALRAEALVFDAVMAGDGPLGASLRSEAERAGISMLGRRDDVPDLMTGSDIFVFTSLAPGEGMPGVLIEAAMAGLATVATRVPGARDVVEDGVTGFLVDISDKAGLVDSVRRLVADSGLRADMGRRARERALHMFTLQASVNNWHRVLDPLLHLDRV